MGWRYRRSVKVLPGVKLNFSKSGVSTTLGVKGARYTIGKNGKRTITAGTPFKGLYLQETYNKKTRKRQKKAMKQQKRASRAVQMRQFYGYSDEGFKRSEWTNHLSVRNKTTTLLICIFLGFLGVHRFYVGKQGTGLIYLFTMGIFGIGWVVDIILILFNRFTDIQGRPLSK